VNANFFKVKKFLIFMKFERNIYSAGAYANYIHNGYREDGKDFDVRMYSDSFMAFLSEGKIYPVTDPAIFGKDKLESSFKSLGYDENSTLWKMLVDEGILESSDVDDKAA
jgi:hypothetical protein